MAVLTDADVREMWRSIYVLPHKADIKAGGFTLDRADLKAALQAIEDFWEANRLNIKNDMDAAISPKSLTNTQAKKLGRAWLAWKFGGE